MDGPMSAAELAKAIERMGLDPTAYIAERIDAQTHAGDEIGIRRLVEIARPLPCLTKRKTPTD